MPGATKLMTAGGGGVNLQPASSIASDVTVQLPVVAQTLIGNKTPGTVLQVVKASATAGTSTTSNTFVDLSGLSASITVSANSSVYIVCTSSIYGNAQGGTWLCSGRIGITRGSTNLTMSEHVGTASSESQGQQVTLIYLDTALAAGTYTYKVQGLAVTNGALDFNRWTPSGQMILMEIAA